MDDDLRTELKDVGRHVQDIGRMIASTKSSMQTITAMQTCLTEAAETLDTYLRIQKERYA
jgi:hypothetical protein